MSLLRTLNPFSRFEHPVGVWAWGMYDLANQSFQLLVNTLLFGIFLREVIVGDPDKGKGAWGTMVAASMVLVVLLSPIVGALADQRAWKREILVVTGLICGLLTALLGFLGPGHLHWAFAIYIVAAVACGLGENMLGAFLPEITRPEKMGFASAVGWTMSYIGALMLLGVLALYGFVLGRNDASQMGPMFILAGGWFLLGMSPSVVFFRERAMPQRIGNAAPIGDVFARVFHIVKESRKYRQLARFLVIFFVYSIGTQTVIYFLGVIGDEMGFGLDMLILFALEVALTAGIASAVTGRFQDRLGHRVTLRVLLGLWVLATGALATSKWVSLPPASFWFISGAIGLALGGIGTASRAVVGAFTPEHRSGEFFGLWGMVYKLSAVVGVLSFGFVTSGIGGSTGQAVGLFMLAGFFGAGFIALSTVNEREGIETAKQAGPAPMARPTPGQ